MPTTSIQPVKNTDLSEIAILVYKSKLSLTINRLLWRNWPNEEAQKAQYSQAVESGFKEEISENLKVVDDQTGEILGYLVLTRRKPAPPKPEAEQGKEATGDEQIVPDVFDPQVFNTVMKAVGEIDKDLQTIDHFDITFIVVKPGQRRRGYGRWLMKTALDRARAEGIPVAVQAEPQAYDFFKKLGFQDLKHFDFDLAKWASPNSGFGKFRLAGMIWNP